MSLIVTALEIPDLLLIEGPRHDDGRGWFMEGWKASAFASIGIETAFVQDNLAASERGVIRGMHYQLPPHAQPKLIRAVRGAIFDVAVDVRRGSPTFGMWCGVELREGENRALFVPEGFAHGYQVLTDQATVWYRAGGEYAPESERSIAFDDPEVGIVWRDTGAPPSISARDRAAPGIGDVGPSDLFAWPVVGP